MKYPLRQSTLTLTAYVILLSGVLYAAPLIQTVTYGGETITMRLIKQNLRGPNFELWAQNASGGYDVITPVGERAYIGTVDEYPSAIASGIVQDDGQFRGAVYFDRGGTWWTLGSSVTGTRALTQPSTYYYPEYTVSAGHGGTTTYRFDVGVDADYDYYSSRAGGSVTKAFELIEYSVTLTRALYMQNVLLRPYLGRVIIRTSQAQDPANGLTGGDYLGALRVEWNNNQTDADRDVVSGVTKSDVGGGLAWVGTIGKSFAYSVSDSDATGNYSNIWRHELGHNWGMGHYDGGSQAFKPEGRTINSGNQFARMSGPEAEKALNERDAKLGFLDNESTYTIVDIPPYAAMDAVTFALTADPQINIDVMANDHDANGDALSILSFDAVSDQGGTITLSGSGSSATLVYSPPSAYYVGPDWFYYEIQDASGQTATGVVTINVEPMVLNKCDFESGFGDWVNVSGDDDYDWIRKSGPTPTSNTGPSGGADGSTWYAYMETSNGQGAYNAGDTVILESPDLDADAYAMTLDFDYHMFGSTIGTLNVDVYDGTWHQGVWSMSGQQQTSSSAAYASATLDLSSYSGIIKIRFRAVAAGGLSGDIAIDNLTIGGVLIPQLISECDFETGFGDWINVSGEDDYDWTRDSGGTPTSSTGPSSGANGSTWYAFMETSAGQGANGAGDTVILESPNLDADAYAMTLNFDYHMYGGDIGTLNVDVYDGTWHEGVWSKTGQQQASSASAYASATLDLSSYSGTIKVRFRAVAAGGLFGDIAIDNITITGIALPQPPEFIADPIILSDGLEGSSYNDTLAGLATDPESQTITYSLTSGPSWLSIASDGALSGIPGDSNTGLNEFTIRATDTTERYTEATLQITVVNRFMGENGMVDFAGLAANWLDSNCGICNGSDLDGDNDVGPADLNILAQNWLAD